jgi:Protein of unknown function (DUF998)
MTTDISTPAVPTTTTAAASADAADARTRLLLAGGAVAGPLFIVVAVIQALTRSGFEPSKHPLSLLSLGSAGWIQIANFVVAGLLFLASAVGIRRALSPGRASTWGPPLIGALGVALVAGGVFVADPGLGFPAGTPEGIPDEMSWHGIAHAAAPPLGFLALTVACFVLARRSFALGQRVWAVVSVAIGVAIQGLGVIPNVTLNFLPLWAAMMLGFGWASVQVGRLLAERGVGPA